MSKRNNLATSTYKWASVLLAFLGMLLVFTKPESVDAASATTAPKTTVVSDFKDYTVDSKYTFIPEWNGSGTTKLTVSSGFVDMNYNSSAGSGKFGTKSLDAGADNWKTIDTNMKKGNYYARYSNVGYYNGQSIDIIITIKDWDRYGLPGSAYRLGNIAGPIGFVSFPKDRIGFVHQGFNYVDLEWKTVKSGTNTAVNTSGYYTYNDIDAAQYIGFLGSTWSNHVDQILITNSSTKLDTWASGSNRMFGFKGMLDINDDVYDSRYAITTLYSDTSAINIRWGEDKAIFEKAIPWFSPTNRYYYLTGSTGSLLMYTHIKPVRTDIPNPTKTQNKSSGLKHNDTVRYTVSQIIPYEHKNFYHSTMEIRDQVDDVYSVQGYRVLDENNKDVTNKFTLSNKNNLVRAVAKSPKSDSFYNKTYKLEIDVKLNAERLLQKIGNGSSYQIKNTGESRIDGKTRKTPSTKIDVSARTITVNHIHKSSGKVIKTEKIKSVDGLSFSTKPRTDLKNSRGHSYRHIETKGRTSFTVSGNESVTFYYDEPKEITIEHRTLTGRDGDKLLGSETVWEYNGKEVIGTSKEKHFKDDEGYFYRPRKKSETITVNGKSTIILRYDTPRTVTTEHRDKDDNRLLRTTYIKGIYDGETYTSKPLIETLRDVDGYFYRPVENKNRVGVVDGHMPIVDGKVLNNQPAIQILYERPRIIEILHKDNDTKDLIQTDIHPKRIYDTDGYEIYSRANEELKYYHKENDTTYFYYPLDPYNGGDRARKTGTVIESQVDKKRNTFTIEFFYTKPSLDLGLTYIRIDTDRAHAGLPVQLEFNHQIIVPDRWKDNDVTLTVYDRDSNVQVYQETDVDVQKLTDGLTMTVDSDHLSKGSKAIYEAVLTTNNKQDLVSGYATQASIDTNAYTASERVVKGESIDDKNVTVEYEGVAMTERRLGEDIREHQERMTATLDPNVNMISGYGYTIGQKMTFETEVKDHSIPKITAKVFAHPNIADGDYEVVDGKHSFDLDAKNTDGKLSRETTFSMPEVFVHRKDGEISLVDSDNRVDGGRKAYVPIWINQLGTYKYNVQSNRLGRNYIQFDLDQNVTIDAYMFGHIDSDTLDDDALLIEPAKTSMLDKWFDNK